MSTVLSCSFKTDLYCQTYRLQSKSLASKQKSCFMDSISIPSNNTQLKPSEISLPEHVNIQLSSIESPETVTSLAIKEELFNNTDWPQIINKNKKSNASKKILLDEEDWKEHCQDSFEDDELPIIPIVVKKHDHYVIEYVKIIKIESEHAYIGVGIQLRITKQLLDSYHARFCRNKSLAPDVINLIMNYCAPLLKVASIHLDADYISYHHQLLLKSTKSINNMDIDPFKPFLSNLKITKGPYLNFEPGEPLELPSEWSDDDDNTTHSA